MNQLKYVANSYSKSGTAFIDTTLEATLKHCLTLPKNGKKGEYGSIFIYNSNQLGVHLENETSTGIILLDIDYIDKNTADTIYNNFEALYSIWNCLLAIQYSSSYYTNSSKNGLHIYIKSEELDYDNYKNNSQICLAIFAKLVETYLNIDLLKLSTKDKPVLDFHNTNLYQRFNLFYSSFKYNNFAVNFDLNTISFNDLEKIILKYNLSLDKEITKAIVPTVNNTAIGKEKTKLKIDRNLHIGQYSGNDIRFRISIIADKLFGDNAKMFCDKYFYYENDKSIYTHYPSGNTINPLIYKWLVENGYIIKNSHNIINNWIDEYTETIVKEIKANRILQIVAPTGTGKTTFINNFLAKYFNSIVIVPHNVTNKLYDRLFEVNANYTGKIPQNKPIVMIWDQAIKHWDEIKDRHFIIDESHALFFDRSYRNSAIKLILKLKENNCHITFVTATPAGEKDIFNLKQLQFFKERAMIRLNIKATKNIEWSQYNYIKKCLDNNLYDKIILLDDSTAKKIYEKFIIECYGDKISYIRSSTKESKDFIELRENELLTKQLTICTCIAFNGLNFKNQNENILVVGSIKQGETTSCEIIQQIGRCRNSKVTALYFYDPEYIFENNIDDHVIKALEYNNMVIQGLPDTFAQYDRKYLDDNYVDAIKEIIAYQSMHSNIDNIISELGSVGYIQGKVEDKINNNEKLTMTLALKRKESNEMKEDILNDVFLNTEYTSEYKKKWAQEINYIISNPFYSGITIDSFKDMFNKGNKHKLIETSINNIKTIIRYVQVDEITYSNVIRNVNLYAAMLSNSIDKKKFIQHIKQIKEIREKYIDKIKFNKGCISFNDIITDVIQMEFENQLKEKIGNSKGGQKGKEIEINGIKYNTVKEAADKLHTSRSQIYRIMNK